LEVGHTASGGALLSWIIIIIYLPFLDALACLDLNNDNLRKAKGQDKMKFGGNKKRGRNEIMVPNNRERFICSFTE
jgi:hypothetical protein